MPFVVAGLVFLAVTFVVWAILSSVVSDERAVARRLGDLTVYETGQASVAHPVLRPFGTRVIAPIGRAVSQGAAALAPEGYRLRTGLRLVRAGGSRTMTVGRFVAIKILLTLAFTMLFVAVAAMAGLSTLSWVFALVFVVVAFFLPDLWLNNAISERQAKIRRELPDILDMLTISVEAGLGFDAALAKLIRTTHGPLATEFGQMLRQVQAGMDRPDAMRALSERTDVPDLDTFINAVIQAETFGISIAKVLRNQAKEMRLKRRQYAEEQAQKAPVKIVFPLVLCILPATMIVILGPAAVSIAEAFNLM